MGLKGLCQSFQTTRSIVEAMIFYSPKPIFFFTVATSLRLVVARRNVQRLVALMNSLLVKLTYRKRLLFKETMTLILLQRYYFRALKQSTSDRRQQ
jgi:hypothetical protein